MVAGVRLWARRGTGRVPAGDAGHGGGVGVGELHGELHGGAVGGVEGVDDVDAHDKVLRHVRGLRLRRTTAERGKRPRTRRRPIATRKFGGC